MSSTGEASTTGLTLLDEVRWHGAPIPGGRSHDLLAALELAAPRSVSDDRLVEAVWFGHERPTSGKALQVLVSRTRSHSSPTVVERTGAGYRLGDVPVDHDRLRRHVGAAQSALARGDAVTARDHAEAALEIKVTSVGDLHDGPLAELREDARVAVGSARTLLGRALSALGRHDEALPLLEPAAEQHAGDEPLLEALLRSEATVRGAPVALARYEAHRADVRDRLGTDPGPDLQRLHSELLARDAPVREGLLHDATRLIGREADVDAISALVRTSRVTSILGAGGLGKTRLAHVLGRRAEQPVVHFVGLAGVTSPDGVAVEVGSVLGVRDSVAGRRLRAGRPEQDLLARILEQLGTAPTLLILDNCEHLVEAVADLVAVLLARAPQLRVLTTTRAPLGLAAERVYPLPELSRADAVELFTERATAARPGVRLEPGQVASLVGRLDGLPLAVELAAAKVRVMSVEEISRRLENRFALLRGGSRDAPERHQTLLAVIDWSWNLLDEEQRTALRRLSVFRDGFSLQAADEVVGVEDAVGLVTALVDQSLVTVHEQESTDSRALAPDDALRYRLLETVREFGHMQVVDSGDDAATEARLRSWAVGFAQQAALRVFSREQLGAMRDLRAEEGNLVDVLRRCMAEGDAVPVVQLLATLSGFWTVSGDHLKSSNLAAEAEDLVVDVEVPPEQIGALRAVLCGVLVNQLMFAGRAEPGVVARLRAVGPGGGEDGGDARIRALVLVSLGLVGPVGPDGPEGRDGLDGLDRSGLRQVGVLDELCADPDPWVSRLALQWSSQALENAGDTAEALEASRAALALVDDEDGPWSRALLTSQLAGLSMQIGDRKAATAYARAALPAMESLGAEEDVVQLRAMLVFSAIAAGRLDEAEHEMGLIDDSEQAPSVFGAAMVVPMAQAELSLARGEIAAGLESYRAVIEQSRSLAIPNRQRLAPGLEPWVLYPEAGAVAAHALHAAGQGRAMRDELARKAAELFALESAFLDFPVTGAVALALAVWDLAAPATSEPACERAVGLLAIADRFSYTRTLPSLGWEHAQQLAERRCPGLLPRLCDELASRKTEDLRPDVRRLVSELAAELG